MGGRGRCGGRCGSFGKRAPGGRYLRMLGRAGEAPTPLGVLVVEGRTVDGHPNCCRIATILGLRGERYSSWHSEQCLSTRRTDCHSYRAREETGNAHPVVAAA